MVVNLQVGLFSRERSEAFQQASAASVVAFTIIVACSLLPAPCKLVCLLFCLSVCPGPTGRSLLSISFIFGILEPSRDWEEAFILEFSKVVILIFFKSKTTFLRLFYAFFLQLATYSYSDDEPSYWNKRSEACTLGERSEPPEPPPPDTHVMRKGTGFKLLFSIRNLGKMQSISSTL